MADGKVKLEVEVTGKNAKIVQRQVEGVTEAVNKNTAAQRTNTKSTKAAADAQDHFSRGLKGVGQSSLSSGKALSKQRDLIGSSSFVGAYATLAANLFAATAAFEAFRKAADVEKVIKSIEILGTTSGTNIKRIGDNIQRITGYGLSMGEAMKAASLGVSAGFDANQLETLAKVAKGASAALGRDLGDSYDRLIRGAAKLEPEILDELGIIVKIEKATQDYAASIGKTVKELSQYERTQAFVNAINTQGITKFGLLAEAVETSPYDKFAASLSNLATASLNWLSNIGKIPDFLSYLSENMFTLGGAIALFASTISKQMLPVLYEGPQNAAIAAEVAAKQATEAVDVAKNAGQSLGQATKNLPEGYKKLLPAIQAGTASLEDQKKAVSSLTKSIKYYDNALSTGKDLRGRALSPEKIQEYTARRAALTSELKNFQAVQKGVSKTQVEAARAVAKQNALTAKSNTLLAASSLSIRSSLSGLGAAFSAYKAEALAGSTSTNTFTKSLAALKAGTFTAALGVRALGSALLAALPYLGLLITFGPMIKDWFVNKFFPEGEIEKRGQMVESLFSKITELTTFLSKTNLQFEINAKEPNFNKSIEGLKLIAASFKEIRTSINSLLNEIATKSQEISKTLYIQPAQAAYTTAAADVISIDTDIRKEEQRLNLINDVIAGKKKVNDLDIASMFLVKTGQLELSELQSLAIGELDKLKAKREEALKDAKTFEGKLLESYNLATFKTTVSEVEGTLATLPTLIRKSEEGVKKGSIYTDLLSEGAPGAKIADDISKRLGVASAEYTSALTLLKAEMDAVEKKGPVSQEQAISFRQRFNEIRTSYDEALTKSTQDAELFLGKVKGMSDEISAVLKTTAEAAGINATPFDKPLESLEALTSGLKTGTKEAEIYNQALKEIFKQESADKLSFDPEKLKKSLRAGATATRNLAIEQAKLQSLESLGSNLKDIAGVDFVLQQQKVKVIDNQLTIQKAQLDLATASNASEQDKAIIITEITRLENERIQGLGAEIEAQQKILSVTNKIFEAEKRSFDLSLDTQKNKLLLSKPGLTLSTREEDALVREQYTARLDFAQKEYNLKIQAIDLEYKLLNAQYALFRERAVKEGYSQETLKILDDSMAQMGQAQAAAFRVAGAEYENLQSILELDLQKASLNFASKVQVSVGSVMKDISDIFYDRVKNAVSLSQQLAETFANTIDAAVDAFVDAIVEGKNIFKAVGDAFRNTLRDSFAEMAKNKLKEGIASIFEAFNLGDMFKTTEQKSAEASKVAAEATAKNTADVKTATQNADKALNDSKITWESIKTATETTMPTSINELKNSIDTSVVTGLTTINDTLINVVNTTLTTISTTLSSILNKPCCEAQQPVTSDLTDMVGAALRSVPASVPVGAATGGMISGPGGPKDDRIPAMLSNGEFVVNAKATQENLKLLQAINSGNLPGFANGGGVSLYHTARNAKQLKKDISGATLSALTAEAVGLISPEAESLVEGLGLREVLKDPMYKKSLTEYIDRYLVNSLESKEIGRLMAGTLALGGKDLAVMLGRLTSNLVGPLMWLWDSYEFGNWVGNWLNENTAIQAKLANTIDQMTGLAPVDPKNPAMHAMGRATGGMISGPGGPKDDKIPAMLSNGEFVVNAASTKKYLSLLEAINSGNIPRFNKGGLVTSFDDKTVAGQYASNPSSGGELGEKYVKSSRFFYDEQIKASENIGDYVNKADESINVWGKLQTFATDNVGKVISAGFTGMATAIASGASPKKAFLGSVLGSLGGVIGGAIGSMAGPAGAAFGSQIGGALGGGIAQREFALGGVMTSSGSMPLQKYARGGIANSPQLAMFGEGSRPEAYVPLPDGRSIPVTMSNGGGNVNNISVNVAVEGGQAQTQTSGGADNTEEYSRRLGAAISNAVKTEIFNQQRPGGLLYKGRR